MSKTTKNTAKKETMYLRSIKKTGKGVKPPKELATFNVDIDFNEASLVWRSNKQSVGNGCFEYKPIENPKRTRRAPQRYSA